MPQPPAQPERTPPPHRDLESTLDGLLALAAKALQADGAAIYLDTAGDGDLRLCALKGLPAGALGHRVARGEGLTGRVAAEGRSLVSDDATTDPRTARHRADWDGGDGRPPVRGVLGVPLRTGTATIGVLELTSYRARAFGVAERGQASILADAAGLLIERTRLADQPPPAALRSAALPGDDPFGVVTLDGALRIAGGSPTFCRLVNQPVEALIDRPILAIVPWLGRPKARDALAAAQHGAPGHLTGIPLELPDGRERMLSVTLIPIANPTAIGTGRFGVLLAVQDITERGRLDAEIRRQNQEAQAARDQLRAVVEVVSHELRTPLTSVLGYARLLRDRLDAPAERRGHWADLVIDKARLMARLVDEVTDLARLGSDRFALQREAVDLAALVQQAAAELTAVAERHFFAVEAEAGLPAVWIDRDRIGQVLTNLLTNAVKFWPEGGTVRISVGRWPAEDSSRRAAAEGAHPASGAAQAGGAGGRAATATPAGYLVVAVRDGGVGIPPELTEHIFEPFYRVHDERLRAVAGTGLGLAVSRGIVEAHGGRIWCAAAPGGGSVFSFTLPVGTGPALGDAAESADDEASPELPSARRRGG